MVLVVYGNFISRPKMAFWRLIAVGVVGVVVPEINPTAIVLNDLFGEDFGGDVDIVFNSVLSFGLTLRHPNSLFISKVMS